MSKDAVKQMFGKMEKDAALKCKYAELMQAHQKETENALAEKLVELGNSSGFAFAKSDLMAARAEFVDKVNSNKELSEGDLASVAGGGDQKNTAITTSIFSLGMICAMTSLLVPLVGVTCGQAMTTSNPDCKNT